MENSRDKNKERLSATYKLLVSNYTSDADLTNELWKEVEDSYSQSHRHYHNLEHLEDLLEQLKTVRAKIKKWNTTLFTLFYHDIVYSAVKKNNEEQSAIFARERMSLLHVGEEEIEWCYQQIIATKYHHFSHDQDTNYFTDSDLSILGRSPEVYRIYCIKIRKEYNVYPSFLYKKGRRKVVKHFLSMDRIFKTEEFYERFEEQARANLLHELKLF